MRKIVIQPSRRDEHIFIYLVPWIKREALAGFSQGQKPTAKLEPPLRGEEESAVLRREALLEEARSSGNGARSKKRSDT